VGRAVVVGCVLLVAVGLIGAAQQLSGFAFTGLWLDLGPPPTGFGLEHFLSVIDIDYALCNFTLGATAVAYAWKIGPAVMAQGLDAIYFDAYGWLGAVSFSSFGEFSTTLYGLGGLDGFGDIGAGLAQWASIAWLSIAGLDLYGFALLDRRVELVVVPQEPVEWNARYGTGFAFGAQGVAGECSIAAEIQFNLWSAIQYHPPGVGAIGYVFMKHLYLARGQACLVYQPGTHFFPSYLGCYDWYWQAPYALSSVVQSQCYVVFSGADVLVGFPFACTDVFAHARFTCDGFDELGVHAFDISLGDCSWLELDEIEITYTLQTKSVNTIDLDLVFCDFVCIEPFFELDMDNTLLEALVFRGFMVETEITKGVTFKAGTVFQPDDYVEIINGGWYFDDLGNRFAGEPDLVCPPDGCFVIYPYLYDEYFALIVDGDSCCGGGFTFSIFNWFDIDDDNPFASLVVPSEQSAGMFGWEHTLIDFSVDVGWNTTLVTGLSVKNEGLDWMKIGFKTRW